ncbi:PREDICTED: uncharacterized protein LOC104991403 isoform X2 [Bison bison bison]|uniref:Uncharacterized protein LOC104991403 isoform X2 n=1 Tax=Bison bison bison TaxID=43346 RepID=A0A6P3HUA8_BISBB|nr:PREDICTED: uncharacterized protein LOC104991403 isoform X2 [Bison bison bison]
MLQRPKLNAHREPRVVGEGPGHWDPDGWAGSQADADGPPGMENGLAGGTGELPRRPQSSPRPQDNYYGGPKEMGW